MKGMKVGKLEMRKGKIMEEKDELEMFIKGRGGNEEKKKRKIDKIIEG